MISSDNLPVNIIGKSIVVVLGMHRSGTSAVTRGLQVFGVELGDRLMPAIPGNNDKGFFEDIDVNAINIELLKRLGQDWHTLIPVPADSLLQEPHTDLRSRAIALLESRLRDVDVFGMKDPRICRLLPFWQGVFEHLQVKVSYVITLRNPLSVARSIERRDKIPAVKSHYLWLEHVVPSVLRTEGAPRVVVDYDLLMDNPEKQLDRIAAVLGFDAGADRDGTMEFSREFLSSGLRHANFQLEDVYADPVVPSPVSTAVKILSDISADHLNIDSEEVHSVFSGLAEQLESMNQALEYIFQLDTIIVDLRQSLGKQNDQIAILSQAVDDKERHIVNLEQMIIEHRAQAEALLESLAQREGELAEQMQALAEQEAQIAELGAGLAQRDGRLEQLTGALAERDAEVAELGAGLAQRDGRLEQLTGALAERDAQVAELGAGLAQRDGRLEQLAGELAERDAQVAELGAGLAQRDGRLEQLAGELAERDAQVAELGAGLAQRDGRLEQLTGALAERDAQIAELGAGLAQRDGRLERLVGELAERDAQVTDLSAGLARQAKVIAGQAQVLASREEQVRSLSQAITQRDRSIHHLSISAAQSSFRLDQVRASLGWKMLKPEKGLRDLTAWISRMIKVEMVPFNQLNAEGSGWVATGDDPQFLLIAPQPWHRLMGWYWLEVEVNAERPLSTELYFDIGEGFDRSRVVRFQCEGKGLRQLPFFVPPNCRAIRLDPCNVPGKFRFVAKGLRKLRDVSALPVEFYRQAVSYERSAGSAGSISLLKPLNEIDQINEDGYCWCSLGHDPYFLFDIADRALRSGWYMIELRVRSNVGKGNAKFYFDYGEGFSEAATLLLPFRSGRMVKRLCHLTATPRHIRLDPFEMAGKFSVERLHFFPVPSVFANDRMLRRLRNRDEKYHKLPIRSIWRDLKNEARTKGVTGSQVLSQRYGKTFLPYGDDTFSNYPEWIENVERREWPGQLSIESTSMFSTGRPKVSIVMPVYNTAEVFLRRAIESVVDQSYPNWELCIADDCSPEPHVRAVLEEYAGKDARIKLCLREENGHISAASNSALALATGEYVALLDHDDELAPHALYFVVSAISQHPSAQVFYSDEDKIDEEGNRSDPHFKPDWNPDLFFSQNYVSHLGVYRRELLEQIGGFRVGLEGSQDQDLLLRCLPHIKPGGIVHIPKVLYHWRTLEGSTALAANAKRYTVNAGIKSLRDFFAAQGSNDVAVEEGLDPNTYRVRYPLPHPEPLVSLLIPTRDRLELLAPCIQSICEKTTYRNFEILILDNDSVEMSTQKYFAHISAKDPRVRVLPYRHPFNFSAINNFGVGQARGELIGLINNDIEVISPEWLSEMVSQALRPEIGCVGAKLYYDDETIQHAGVILGVGGVAGHSHKYFHRSASGYFSRLKIVQNLSAVTAACLLVRRSVYEEVGGLDEIALSVAFNDVDFCLKVREAGYRNLWTPYAELYHHESKSRGGEDTPEKQRRFAGEVKFMLDKWGSQLTSDPAYNENLTKTHEDFSLNKKW